MRWSSAASPRSRELGALRCKNALATGSLERAARIPQRGALALSQDDAKSRLMRKVIQCEKLGQHGTPARKSAGCAGGRRFKTADRGGRVNRTRIRCDGDAEIWRKIRRSAKIKRSAQNSDGAQSQGGAKSGTRRKSAQCEKAAHKAPARRAKSGRCEKPSNAKSHPVREIRTARTPAQGENQAQREIKGA